MTDLVKRLRIKAGMIEMCERIAWGSDSALMREAADALEMTMPAPAVQGEQIVWATRPTTTTNKPGTVTQQPLYGCTSCYEDCTYTATDLRVYDNECWCEACWDIASYEVSGGIDWTDLAPFKPALQAECERLWGLLEEALHHVIISPDPVRGGFIQEIEAALAAMQEPMIGRRDMDETTNKETT